MLLLMTELAWTSDPVPANNKARHKGKQNRCVTFLYGVYIFGLSLGSRKTSFVFCWCTKRVTLKNCPPRERKRLCSHLTKAVWVRNAVTYG